jgi:hypothetical protein
VAARKPLFLERASYRRRRLGDAARLLPVIALVLLLLPVWWVPGLVSLTGGAIWLFCLWAALIGLTALLHATLGASDRKARWAADAGGDAGDEGDDDR